MDQAHATTGTATQSRPPVPSAAADLRARARASFRDVVADPQGHAGTTAALLAEARAADEPTAVVLALRAQAWVERSRLSNDRAKELLDEAARMARRLGLQLELRDVLLTRAAVNHELGRLVPAQRDLDVAGQLRVDRAPELVFQQAVLHQNLGRLSSAAGLYTQILAAPQTPVDVAAKTMNNLAIIRLQTGRIDDAAALVDHGLALPGLGPHQLAVLASTSAWVTTQTGRLTQGLAEFEEAARLHRVAGLPLAEHFLEYVDALTDLRLLPEAYEIAVQAAEELDRHDTTLMAAEALLRLARLGVLLGDLDAAQQAATRARDYFAVQHRRPWAARADVVLAEAALAAGTASAADLSRARRAAATLDRARLPWYAVDAHLVAGRLALALGRPAMARVSLGRAARPATSAPLLLRLKAHLARALAEPEPNRSRLRACRAGLADLARHRSAFSSLELRVRASGHGSELGQLGLDVLVRSGTPAEVLSWMERTRAAALVAVEPNADAADDDDLAELRVVQTELADSESDPGADSWPLLAVQRDIEDRIRRRTWSAAGSVAAAEAVSTAELRAQIGDRVLVEYAVLADRVLAVVLQRRRTVLVELGPVDEIKHYADVLLFGLRRLTRAQRSVEATQAARTSVEFARQALHARLLDPLPITADDWLVVSPVTGLRRIPWSALHPGPVTVVPAATFWERSSRPRARTDSVLLAAGPDLPGAVEEINQLQDLHPAPTVLAPPESTIAAVLPGLAEADLAHLACHGRLRADNPAFSGLQLSDGLLTLHELEIRGVAPYRMVLAACDSAVDAVYEGNEVLGFVGALLARGTCGLVASIVVVPDAAAVPLMRGLHANVSRGHTLGEAMFRARADLDLEDPHALVNWCAFNAYGAA